MNSQINLVFLLFWVKYPTFDFLGSSRLVFFLFSSLGANAWHNLDVLIELAPPDANFD